jgi:hypothetical protein
MKDSEKATTGDDGLSTSVTRRKFIGAAALSGVALAPLTAPLHGSRPVAEIDDEKIRRVVLAGPSSVTAEATVAEMDHQGNLTVLRPGRNEWVCVPGDENFVGRPDMALDPMAAAWAR